MPKRWIAGLLAVIGLRRLMFQATMGAAVIVSFPSTGAADCFCMFSNGVLQPICGSSVDLRPSCGPFLPPAPRVLLQPGPPPSWAGSCSPAIICDSRGTNCRRRMICG